MDQSKLCLALLLSVTFCSLKEDERTAGNADEVMAKTAEGCHQSASVRIGVNGCALLRCGAGFPVIEAAHAGTGREEGAEGRIAICGKMCNRMI